MSGPRLLSCQQERGCQESEMTSASRKPDQEKVASSGKDVRKKCQGEKDAQTSSKQAASKRKVCEDAEMSGASQIKRQ